jgi:hypothetical protein
MPGDEHVLPVSSSTPPDLVPEALECYRGVLGALGEAQIPYAVAGAFALHKHTGIWRNTKDLDVVLEAASVPRALSSLERIGFKTHIQDPVWLAKAARGEYFVDLITALGNAVLIVDKSWLDRAEAYTILDVSCPVLAAEEIIASKLFVSRRERFDGADVAHLIRACGSRLDWGRLQQLLTGHWELLLWSLVFFSYIYPSHLDLVPEQLWSTLTRQLNERVRSSPQGEPFRGTLIDPNMFAIDVKEWGERDLYQEYLARHPSLLKITEATEAEDRS